MSKNRNSFSFRRSSDLGGWLSEVKVLLEEKPWM